MLPNDQEKRVQDADELEASVFIYFGWYPVSVEDFVIIQLPDSLCSSCNSRRNGVVRLLTTGNCGIGQRISSCSTESWAEQFSAHLHP